MKSMAEFSIDVKVICLSAGPTRTELLALRRDSYPSHTSVNE